MNKYIVFLVIASCCAAQEGYRVNHPLPFEWPASSEQAAVVQRTLTPKAVADNVLNNADEVDLPVSVEDFTFAEMERGKLYLVASVDASGRGLFYATDLMYCKSPEWCTGTGVYDAPPQNYSEELVDVDGDGIKAIVAKSLAGGYEGGNSVDIFTYKIYKVIDGNAVDVSAQYKAYYDSTLLPKMKADLERARAEHPGKAEREIVEALGTLAQDEYARRILKQPTPLTSGWLAATAAPSTRHRNRIGNKFDLGFSGRLQRHFSDLGCGWRNNDKFAGRGRAATDYDSDVGRRSWCANPAW